MSQKDFTRARALLPAVLARLSREGGSGAPLGPIWEDVVGPVTAKHTRALRFEGDALLVEVESPRWRAALEAQEAEIVARLRERLGGRGRPVARLGYQTVEPK